jgi:rhodanese-related sulfurtransferase
MTFITAEYRAKQISLTEARARQQRGEGIIIDVREPAEFKDGHLPGAVNHPSTRFSVTDYRAYRQQAIFLVCQTGDRANEIARKLHKHGITRVFVLDRHLEDIALETPENIWSVDRQFRFLLGILLGLFLIGYHWASDYFLVIPIILCLGLTITAIIDKCYLRVGIARLPWNKGAEIGTPSPVRASAAMEVGTQ